MEWKSKYTKKIKPAYSELLDFFEPHIRDLFLMFDKEMQERFKVHNKYHRYLTTAGWAYGYGRSYNCELLTVTVDNECCFNAGGISVKDAESLKHAITEAEKLYKDGDFEEYCTTVSTKRKKNQIERAKKRVEREKLQMENVLNNVDVTKFNKFKWCEKVSRNDLLRLYKSESKGLLDEELLDEIGYTFYTRCKQAKEIRECMDNGQIICHHCSSVIGGYNPSIGSVIQMTDNNALINCDCGYSYTYREYRRTCNTVNMPGGRATPIFENYLQKWQNCKNSTDKMMLIDWLIHECHVTLMSGLSGRSVCINLIEGTLKQISDLINKLAYGNVFVRKSLK